LRRIVNPPATCGGTPRTLGWWLVATWGRQSCLQPPFRRSSRTLLDQIPPPHRRHILLRRLLHRIHPPAQLRTPIVHALLSPFLRDQPFPNRRVLGCIDHIRVLRRQNPSDLLLGLLN